MDNLLFTAHSTTKLDFGQPLRICYEHATKTIVLLDKEIILYFLQYSLENANASIRNRTQRISELEGENIVLFEYLADTQSILILTQNGSIMTISETGAVDIKAQNDDGISGGSVSPDQQHIYVVTKNNTLIQLNSEFDLVKQVPLDDHQTEKVDSYSPKFSWKADGTFFAINILTDKGRKCHTRDQMLGIFRSPSKSDVQPEGLVQSVSQKSRHNFSGLVAWQPSAGIIAGSDFINKGGKKINRIIFWQKNGLRHLQFQLPSFVTDVLEITWSADSQILAVQVLLINSQRWLYLYYRSNYYWFLKSTLRLSNQDTKYFLTKKKYNQIVIIDQNIIQAYQYKLETISNKWLNYQQQKKSQTVLQVNIDGKILKISDFSMGLIPPPMSHHNAQFQSNIRGVALCGPKVLVLTQREVWMCCWSNGKLDERKNINLQEDQKRIFQIPTNLKMDENIVEVGGKVFQLTQQSKIREVELDGYRKKYKFHTIIDGISQTKQVQADLEQGVLQINHDTYAENCTSFAFYHQFLIFTVSSSVMYDKMFIFDLQLDQLNNVKDSVKMRLEQMQSKKYLNYRSIQRGSKIVGCSKNRVVFQLPRGNLEGIFPKVISIKHVKKCMLEKNYKEAFETIRTHKLDLNLLFDLNPEGFTANSEQILLGVKRIDYLNLFISQLKDSVSTQLQYCKTSQQIEEIKSYIEVNLEGKKIKQVCKIVSKDLRRVDKQKFILSIFTSEIKMGLLNNVLFEIKQLRQSDVEVLLPPHIQAEQVEKKKKGINSQQVLEYVCWLVDANAIYEASLLTYDLQLASMTARCTQMDPKQYIPYLEELKKIEDPIELRQRICMDLKKYENCVEQLSRGNEGQVAYSLQLIKKHKLFKCGLKAYNSNPNQLHQVKLFLIDHLLESGDSNQAYKICLSTEAYQKALQIAIGLTDGSKIKQVIESDQTVDIKDKIQRVKKIVNKIGEDGFKNKNDYAKLKSYVGDYNEATSIYLRVGNYQKAFKTYLKASPEYKKSPEFTNGMTVLFSLQRNLLIKQKAQFLQKSARLQKVHKNRSIQGPVANIRNIDNDDMYSEVSMSSKAASEYTVSTTTGLRKKRDKKRSILTRNVKEGSPLEQQYLIAFLVDLQNRVDSNIKQTKLLIQHLIYINLISQAEILRNTCKQYGQVACKINPKFYAQVKFESDHPQYQQLLEVYENKGIIEKDKGKQRRDKYSIDSFNYMF